MARRSSHYDRGRWQTQRDRLRLLDERPPAPVRIRKISEVLPEVLGDFRLGEQALMLRLQASWQEVVGRQIATQAKPGRIDNKVLTIYVRHSIWLAELKSYEQEILAKVQRCLSARDIQRICLRIDPGDT